MRTEANLQNSFFMNPMIRKLYKVSETADAEQNAVSYGGVAAKVIFFMLWAVVGVVAFYIVRPQLTAGEVIVLDNGMRIHPLEAVVFLGAFVLSLIAPLLAFAIKPLVPVLGSVYCLCFSYSFTCLGDLLPAEYGGMITAATVITIILVAVMAILYMTGVVSVTHKFRTVVTTLFFTALLSGVVVFLLSLIPGFEGILTFIRDNVAVSIAVSVLYIIIACLFLLVDFQAIRDCVEKQLPKKYEWIGAFGLAYTIFYLFLQVFNLISKIQNSGKTQS